MRISKRRGIAILIVCIAACALATPALAGRVMRVVRVEHITFSPGRLVVQRGESVTWQFLDAPLLTHHNVTSIGRSRFRSSQTMFAGTYTVRFNTKGTFRYRCTIHDFMSGTVLVR